MKESAAFLLGTHLKEKTMQALQEFADKKIRHRMIVDRFNMRSKLVTKSEVLRALRQNIALTKYQAAAFYQKIVFVARKSLETPFDRWVDYVYDRRNEDAAKKFHFKRKSMYIKRIALDALRVYKSHRQQKNEHN